MSKNTSIRVKPATLHTAGINQHVWCVGSDWKTKRCVGVLVTTDNLYTTTHTAATNTVLTCVKWKPLLFSFDRSHGSTMLTRLKICMYLEKLPLRIPLQPVSCDNAAFLVMNGSIMHTS